MLITAIEPRRKAMSALYLDGEYVMNLDTRTLIENRFDVGKDIDDEDLHEIIRLSNERRAKEKALWLISYRDHSKKELADKNQIIKNFDMSKNKAGAQDDSKGVYVTAGKAQETDAGLQVKLVIHNQTTNPPKFLSDLKVRYYFNISEQLEKGEDASFIETRIDYDQESSFTDGKNHATISEPIKYDDKGTYYVEITWKDCNFYGSRTYQFGLLNKMNPDTYDTVWDSENDYSYSDLISFEDDNDAAALTEKVPVQIYCNRHTKYDLNRQTNYCKQECPAYSIWKARIGK